MTRDGAAEYRRRAQDCLDMARALSLGAKREILTDMAQTWLQLAEEQEAMPSLGTTEQQQPVMQQQAQPKDDKKE